jgi:hypothetical protein
MIEIVKAEKGGNRHADDDKRLYVELIVNNLIFRVIADVLGDLE